MFELKKYHINIIELISALIRVIKPNIIFETGSFGGYGAVTIGETAKAIGSKIYTVQNDVIRFSLVKDKVEEYGLRETLFPIAANPIKNEAYRNSVYQSPWKPFIDFAFIDCSDNLKAYKAMSEHLESGATVCIHNTNLHPVTSLRVFDYLSDPKIPLPVVDMITFKAGNGLTIFTHP